MISSQEKKTITAEYGKNSNDTGSVFVQCAIFTARIRRLTEHLKIHKHDSHCRRSLFVLLGKRNKLLRYAKKKIGEYEYSQFIKKIGVRK